MTISMCCRGRDDAHYGWCVQLGGSGLRPGSIEELIAKAKAAARAAHPSAQGRPPADRQSEPIMFVPSGRRPTVGDAEIVAANGIVSVVERGSR